MTATENNKYHRLVLVPGKEGLQSRNRRSGRLEGSDFKASKRPKLEYMLEVDLKKHIRVFLPCYMTILFLVTFLFI